MRFAASRLEPAKFVATATRSERNAARDCELSASEASWLKSELVTMCQGCVTAVLDCWAFERPILGREILRVAGVKETAVLH